MDNDENIYMADIQLYLLACTGQYRPKKKKKNQRKGNLNKKSIAIDYLR